MALLEIRPFDVIFTHYIKDEESSILSRRAWLHSKAHRGAGGTDGIYAELKGTPAERSENRKVSLAEDDHVLTSSSLTGLNLTTCNSVCDCLCEGKS